MDMVDDGRTPTQTEALGMQGLHFKAVFVQPLTAPERVWCEEEIREAHHTGPPLMSSPALRLPTTDDEGSSTACVLMACVWARGLS